MIFIILLLSLSLNSCSDSRQNETLNTGRLQKDTCDDADADAECCFLNMPENLNRVINIAGQDEPGRRMNIKGKILMDDSITPLSDVIIYAYHTDNSGYYTKIGNEKGIQKWHGHLHGWGKTDASGNYEINSIRPARYPENRFPAHIHAVLKIPGKIPFYINDFVFKDDSLVNENYTGSLISQGGTGIVELKENPEKVLLGERNIILNIK